jgi:electron transfer flavoprotein alpha subunit
LLLLPFRPTVAAFLASLLFAVQPLAQGAPAQAVNAAQPRTQASLALGNSLQQVSIATAHLRRAIDSINVPKWKAPGDVRQTTESDVDSMQRDVSDTLPALINSALADPAKISPAFSVYRNVDALYDVLLRVSETAQLAGSNDARLLEDQRSALEDARTQLGAALLQSAQSQDAEVVHLRSAAVAPPPPPPAAKTVVDDGPAPKSKPSTKKRTTHKPATTSPSPAPAPATPQ